MITCFIPENDSLGCFEENKIINGLGVTKTQYARSHGGRRVIALTPQAFRNMLAGPNGLMWERENWEAIDWLHKNQLNPDVDAFPGEGRPALA